mgnify:CR=1 FL=1
MTRDETQFFKRIPEAIDREIVVDGKSYATYVLRRVCLPSDYHRLVVVSHVPNPASVRILNMCIRSIMQFTNQPYELWIVDNNSPLEYVGLLVEGTGVNVLFNRTEPVPVWSEGVDKSANQLDWGSYANAIGLELAVRVIDPASKYLMTLHMDSLPCHPTWLSYLTSKITSCGYRKGSTHKGIAAAGVRMDRTRTPEGVLHVLGCLVDYQVFRVLGLSFFPELPEFDVGDKVTIGLRNAGYGVFACRNTLWEPELQNKIDGRSPWHCLSVDRALDDANRVIFCHLGRGVRKASGSVSRGAPLEEWLDACNRNLGADFGRQA